LELDVLALAKLQHGVIVSLGIPLDLMHLDRHRCGIEDLPELRNGHI